MAQDPSTREPIEGEGRGWFKSTFSTAACTCVEVNLDGERVRVRDSKQLRTAARGGADEAVIAVERDDWNRFLADVDAGSRRCHTLAIGGSEEEVTLSSRGGGVELRFTPGEWQAFLAGVRAGEFVA